MKTIEELDTYFVTNKFEISINRFDFGETWHVACSKKDDGITLKVTTSASSLLDALYDTYEKFEGVVRRGAPNLLAPQLEHAPEKKSWAESREFDSDCDPF